MLNALTREFIVLLQFLLLCSIFSGIGLLLLKRTAVTFSGSGEKLFFASGVGASITGYAVFALATAQLLYPPALWSLVALCLLVAAKGWHKSGVSLRFSALRPVGTLEWIAASFLAIALAAALMLTLAPETGRDALTYHLAAPKLFLQHHGFYFIPGNPLSQGPFHAEMLFLLSLFLDGDVLAKLVNFAFFLAILLGIFHFARHRMERNVFPYLGMLVFASIPSVFLDAHTAYIDLAAAFFMMGALVAFLNWIGKGERSWLVLCALFTGTALATKFTTIILPFLGCLGILWGHRNREKGTHVFRDLPLYLLVTLLFGAPFYLKNWLTTGNPFYPFLYGVFGGKGWDAEQARMFDGMILNLGMGRGLIDYLLLPWNLSFHAKLDSRLFDGVIGPIFLLVLPFLAGMRKPPVTLKVVMLYCLLVFAFWASAAQQIRYLIPIFPLLALLVGAVLTRYRENRGVAVFLGVAVVGSLLFNASRDVSNFARFRPFKVVAGLEDREAYLNRTLAPYTMYRYLDTLPADSRIFLIYMKQWSFLCNRECYTDYMFESYTLQKILASSTSPEDAYRKLKGRGFTHLMYDANYLTGEKSALSAKEIALFASMQDQFLTLVKKDRSYYLYRL